MVSKNEKDVKVKKNKSMLDMFKENGGNFFPLDSSAEDKKLYARVSENYEENSVNNEQPQLANLTQSLPDKPTNNR